MLPGQQVLLYLQRLGRIKGLINLVIGCQVQAGVDHFTHVGPDASVKSASLLYSLLQSVTLDSSAPNDPFLQGVHSKTPTS